MHLSTSEPINEKEVNGELSMKLSWSLQNGPGVMYGGQQPKPWALKASHHVERETSGNENGWSQPATMEWSTQNPKTSKTSTFG